MSAAPLWAYILGILLALPVLVLVLGLGVIVLRLFLQWLFPDMPAMENRIQMPPTKKADLKG
jgi:hypothetical protein